MSLYAYFERFFYHEASIMYTYNDALNALQGNKIIAAVQREYNRVVTNQKGTCHRKNSNNFLYLIAWVLCGLSCSVFDIVGCRRTALPAEYN